MIDFNITLFIQFINFLVSLLFINFLIISPIRSVVRKRAEEMTSLQLEINALEEQIEVLCTKYADTIDSAHLYAENLKKNSAIEAKKAANSCIVETREKSQLEMVSFEKQLLNTYASIYDELLLKVATFSTTIFQRLVK